MKLLISAENSEYQIIQSLKTNRVKRKKLNEIFIEGIECIKQAAKSNTEITRIIVKDINKLSDWGKNMVKLYGHVKIIEMADSLYNNLADKTEPSEMLITAKIRPLALGDLSSKNPFLIVFDRPGDYGNLGSIIRSANAFKADAVFIIGHGVDVYDSKVIRASLGSIFFTGIIQLESMEDLLDYIDLQKSKCNIQIVGTDSLGAVSLKDNKIARPLMLIFGNEKKGMSRKLSEICDKIIKIPLEGNVNSLNVSCAASILMWEAFKNS